jgi:hypothetical protein
MKIRNAILAGLALACTAGVSVLSTPRADAFPSYLQAWEARYPASTLPDDMATLVGSSCFTCHNPNDFSTGTCYRVDIINRLKAGDTIQQALAAVETLDSDGDGVPNLVEILAPRPGGAQVGFHPGLRGPAGVDPCYTPGPNDAVSSRSETPKYGACCSGVTCSLQVLDACVGANRRFVGDLTACNAPANDTTPCCRVDFNQDQKRTPADIFAFLNAFFAQNPQADWSGDATLAPSDIFLFLNAYFVGC